MNATEAGKLVALMALYDNRKVSDPDIVAWLKVVGDLQYGDCESAVVAHYQETRERIMPADIRQRVRVIRAKRLDRAEVPAPPPELVDDWPAYQAALHAARVAAADGRDPEAASQAVANPVRLRIEAPHG